MHAHACPPPVQVTDPVKRIPMCDVLCHPWVKVGMPQDWDELNDRILAREVDIPEDHLGPSEVRGEGGRGRQGGVRCVSEGVRGSVYVFITFFGVFKTFKAIYQQIPYIVRFSVSVTPLKNMCEVRL